MLGFLIFCILQELEERNNRDQQIKKKFNDLLRKHYNPVHHKSLLESYLY